MSYRFIYPSRPRSGRQVCRKTKKSFDKFCRNRSKAAPLVYENTWKGIISSSILHHHFHYAYFIHTAAVLVYHDHSYLHSIRDYVHDLIRDVNNSDQSDPYFPLFRNFDWFLGHSLATGLDTNIDGKIKKLHFLYSVKVWAENEKDAIHMIQVIPITPITSFIRCPEFIWQEWTNTGSPTENTRQVCQIATKLANGYQTLLLTQYGIVDPNYVYNIFVKKLWMCQEIPLDDGLSLSWILGFLINQIELNKSEEKNGC
ncbi:hypothetical protein H4Q26_011888 [Puccinia striiformis f. sp. tritici PST-130]|nr:hypothetical protein H4Q26_011888 [Puccinia striiformis f. sp. tritici PST-130]